MPFLMRSQVFFSRKHRSTRFALVVFQLKVDRADVSLIALLPGELHAAVLALVLLLLGVQRPKERESEIYLEKERERIIYLERERRNKRKRE